MRAAQKPVPTGWHTANRLAPIRWQQRVNVLASSKSHCAVDAGISVHEVREISTTPRMSRLNNLALGLAFRNRDARRYV